MATALWPLQVAVFNRMTGRSSLMSLVTGVFDAVPDGQAYPYVSLGPVIEVPDDAHDRQGLSSLVYVHVWSKQSGSREASAIFAEVDAALDRQPLVVPGYTDITIKNKQHEAIRDPDPEIRHISAQYSVRMTRI
ncbi:DUF3168 domain-containing protein [Streptomyces sp. CA-250714]|uniref:DUF3168 domain-containing protein n=1 Tax=Streptomyces sp. CA-250714 TaxID=3240060 RepID=UPI003D8DB963